MSEFTPISQDEVDNLHNNEPTLASVQRDLVNLLGSEEFKPDMIEDQIAGYPVWVLETGRFSREPDGRPIGLAFYKKTGLMEHRFDLADFLSVPGNENLFIKAMNVDSQINRKCAAEPGDVSGFQWVDECCEIQIVDDKEVVAIDKDKLTNSLRTYLGRRATSERLKGIAGRDISLEELVEVKLKIVSQLDVDMVKERKFLKFVALQTNARGSLSVEATPDQVVSELNQFTTNDHSLDDNLLFGAVRGIQGQNLTGTVSFLRTPQMIDRHLEQVKKLVSLYLEELEKFGDFDFYGKTAIKQMLDELKNQLNT